MTADDGGMRCNFGRLQYAKQDLDKCDWNAKRPFGGRFACHTYLNPVSRTATAHSQDEIFDPHVSGTPNLAIWAVLCGQFSLPLTDSPLIIIAGSQLTFCTKTGVVCEKVRE